MGGYSPGKDLAGIFEECSEDLPEGPQTDIDTEKSISTHIPPQLCHTSAGGGSRSAIYSRITWPYEFEDHGNIYSCEYERIRQD